MSDIKIGKVYLTGAGPGDPGLVTVKAADAMAQADVLIYDNLVNEQLLNYCSEKCEKIYVGKSGSHHTFEQKDINQLLIDKAKQGKIIVRLKGGDPFIFGRGGEEALCLREQGIAFEIINGVSSAYAVPAYAGIPVTHRGIASAVSFITGHEDPTKEQSHINWKTLATSEQTLVFLMGVKNLPLICKELQANGMPSDTPAAIIQDGTYPGQKTVSATLDDIHEKARAAGMKPPAIIVIGKVAALRGQLSWFEKRPLYGKRIVVTRSREQASQVVKQLDSLGADVVEVPVIRIIPPENDTDLLKAISCINEYDWIVFTSVNGVEYFFRSLHKQGHDSRKLAGVKICAIGTATAQKLEKQGIYADLIPEKYISSYIVESLEKKGEIKNKKFLLPRADIAPETLQDALLAKGAGRVDNLVAYRTSKEKIEDDSGKSLCIKNKDFDLVTFTSSSTVTNFLHVLEKLGVKDYSTIQCAAIGPVTASTARECGFRVVIEAEVHTIQGLVEAIIASVNR